MLARPLFDEDVLLSEANPTTFEGNLLLEEEAQISSAVDKRRREYVAGRTLARGLFCSLGCPEAPLVNDKDRAPIWPQGVVASISHTGGYCGVVAARASEYDALGLDVEQASPLEERLLRAIIRDDERAWLDTLDVSKRLHVAKWIFSAKEAAYKAQYTLSREFLGFSAMSVRIDERSGTFTATFMRDAGVVFREGHELTGRIIVANGFVACGVSIRGSGATAGGA